MIERWSEATATIPEPDMQDIILDSPMFNAEKKGAGPCNQPHPEFAQRCYLKFRQDEERTKIKDYLVGSSPKPNGKTKSETITSYDRSYAIQKIFDLHMNKDYKKETLFMACNILDHYLYKVGA